MNYKNTVVAKLAQAIIDVQAADGRAALSLVLARLSSELDEIEFDVKQGLAAPTAPLKPKTFEMLGYDNQNGNQREIPRGYKLFASMANSQIWPDGFRVEKGEPVYIAAPNNSGAPYVDLWLVRRPNVEPSPSGLEAFKALLMDDGYVVKTMNNFNEYTDMHVFVIRVMEHHDKFCEHQKLYIKQDL